MRAGLADRGQAVGDDDRGAAGEQAPQPVLDRALGVQVDVRRRLVEDEDARVGDERAGEGDELPLAGGELHAALADLGVEPVGQPGDEVPGADRARGVLELLVAWRPARPNARLSATVPLNRNASCGTMPICERSDATVTSRRSWPSTSTAPLVGS